MPLLFFMRRRRWQDFQRILRQASIRQSLIRTSLYLALVLSLHVLAMMFLEGLSLADAWWLTATTVVTVGYGDLSADTGLGRIATVLLVYIGGIFVLFHAAADYFDYRTERRLKMLRGRWRWHMKDHVLLLNSPTINPDRYFARLVEEFREHEAFADTPVLLLTPEYPEGLPEHLLDLGLVHYHGHATDPEAIAACDTAAARIIIVLAERAVDPRSDATTFDILHRITESGTKATILAESVDDTNRERLRRSGARVVLRPVRFYPEIAVRAVICPGSEAILENLFTASGDECHGYKLRLKAKRWADVVHRLMEEGVGTAIAYAAADGKDIRCNPRPDEAVDATAIFVIAKENHVVSSRRMATIMDGL